METIIKDVIYFCKFCIACIMAIIYGITGDEIRFKKLKKWLDGKGNES